MDLRKRRTHSSEKLPLLSTRWVKVKRAGGTRFKVKQIKVAHTYNGASTGKWINYSRWLYENNKGPVPKGMRVLHKDGDVTNFELDNLILGTAADVLWIHCHADPAKSAANYSACRAATSEFNRESARIRRERGPLPSRWYAVDLAARHIVNTAARRLSQALGCAGSSNGSGFVGWRLGWPSLPASDACVLAVLVRVASPRAAKDLVDLVERLRQELRISPARLTLQSVHQAASRLVRDGWIEHVRRGVYRAAPKARAERGPVCPYVFLRGDELIADPQYRGFAFVLPATDTGRSKS